MVLPTPNASIRLLLVVLASLLLAHRPDSSLSAEPFELSESYPADGSDSMPVSIAVQLRFSEPVEADTLTSIELFRVDDSGGRVKVEIRPATDLTNASITLVPERYLSPFSRYELIGDQRLKAKGDHAFSPFNVSFRTGEGISETQRGLMFSKETFDRNRSMTTVSFGPDRRLYAADAFGNLVRWEIDDRGRPEKRTTLLSDRSESRQYIDLEWDPEATADNLIVWVSYGERTNYEEERRFFTGTIARLTLGEEIVEEIVVKGLPHGREKQGGFETLPHQPNGLVFRDGYLYQSIGSTSSSGGPPNWGIPEQRLSACIVKIDYRNINSPLDVHPLRGYDPINDVGTLQIFATGVRNALEIVSHSNGNLYTAVNLNDRRGPADGVPDDPDIAGDQNLLIEQTTPDQESLLLLREGRHYGFPNPMRGQYVLGGGNPTESEDPFEISDYPVGTYPEPGFAPELMYPIWKYGGTSPNGMIEYLPSESHPLSHALICCFYSAGDIAVMPLDATGLPNAVEKLRGREDKLQFNGPLDITMDPETGIIYVADFGTQNKFGSDGSLCLLRPMP
ncbi:Ig-like domain-containing protein [Pelagicoccus sp. SDUM812002]|uniref:Ig-like domain-containing protein n=1 Tax=Pelagicoccus sp. SDUM812002 TaxID=3041266 RepID=UPI00280EC120|nr:Ig-like domain-containing protein [Pelagicoccus sp. SDUM812002]MDQ8184739.1 Ig-like domain-containing protein [Pelagicoccus sp. SDUM812002]